MVMVGFLSFALAAAITLAAISESPYLERITSVLLAHPPKFRPRMEDRMFHRVGVRIVEVSTAEELEAAFGPRTAMIYIFAGPQADKGPLSTQAIARMANQRRVPVLVDAAAEVLTVPNRTVVISCSSLVSSLCPGGAQGTVPSPGLTYSYLFKHGPYANDTESPYPQMTGKDLKLTGTQQDFDPTTGLPIVTMQFTSHGNDVFHNITRAEAVRGQTLGAKVEQSA